MDNRGGDVMNVSSSSPYKELLIERARACIGVSTYQRKATLEEAPRVMNCFRFMQWLWNPVGILLPDHQLIWPLAIPVNVDEADIADLVFVPRWEYALSEDDFGHVGIATGEGTIIHATKWRNGVVEDPLSTFVARGCLGVRRIPYQHYCRS
jgi:cell wall-associated NlpC family hydrolase